MGKNKPRATYAGRVYTHCEVVADPVRNKDLKEPVMLVRRRVSNLVSPNDADVDYFEGPPAISLFTGCGGFDLGIEQAGFTPVVQHEWDGSACETLIANRPRCFGHAALIQGDINKTPTSMILEAARLRVGEARILIGGPPCQGFSYSNSNRGKQPDMRNDLVFQYLRVIREAQPHFFLFENVPGFQEFNKGSYVEAFMKAAHESYYELVYGLIDAVEYGVPQFRCRFLVAGTRRDLFEIDGVMASLPKPERFNDPDLNKIRLWESGPLFDAELEKLTHAPGVRYFPDRPFLRVPQPIGNRSTTYTRSKRFVEFYDRLEKEEPDRIVKHPVNAEMSRLAV